MHLVLRIVAGVPLLIGLIAMARGLVRRDGPPERAQLHIRKVAAPPAQPRSTDPPPEEDRVAGEAAQRPRVAPDVPPPGHWRVRGLVTRDGAPESHAYYGFPGFDVEAEWGSRDSLIQRVKGRTHPVRIAYRRTGNPKFQIDHHIGVGQSDVRGQFEVEGLGERPPARWWARTDWFGMDVAVGRPVSRGDGNWSLVLAIPPCCTVVGLVTTSDGRPAQANVVAALPDPMSEDRTQLEAHVDSEGGWHPPQPALTQVRQTRTTSYGEYRLGGLVGSHVRVWAVSGEASGVAEVDLRPPYLVRADIVVHPPGEGPGRHLRGFVGIPGAGPVADCHLVLASRDPPDEPYLPYRETHTVTTEDGSFVISLRTEIDHRDWAMVVWGRNHRPVIQPLRVPLDPNLPIHIEVAPGWEIRGSVVEESRPGVSLRMAGADVLVEAGYRRPDVDCCELPGGLLRIVGDWVPTVSVSTHQTGEFSFPHLAILEARIEVLPQGERSDDGAEVRWEVVRGPQTVSPPCDANFRLRRRDGRERR